MVSLVEILGILCFGFIPLILLIVLNKIGFKHNWIIVEWINAFDGDHDFIALILWVIASFATVISLVGMICMSTEWYVQKDYLVNNTEHVEWANNLEHPTKLQCEEAEAYNVKDNYLILKENADTLKKIDTTKMWAKFLKDVEDEKLILN